MCLQYRPYLGKSLSDLKIKCLVHICECGHISSDHAWAVCLFLIQTLVDDHSDLTPVYFPAFRPEKMAKLPVILGNLDVTIDSVAPDLTSKLRELAPCSQRER